MWLVIFKISPFSQLMPDQQFSLPWNLHHDSAGETAILHIYLWINHHFSDLLAEKKKTPLNSSMNQVSPLHPPPSLMLHRRRDLANEARLNVPPSSSTRNVGIVEIDGFCTYNNHPKKIEQCSQDGLLIISLSDVQVSVVAVGSRWTPNCFFPKHVRQRYEHVLKPSLHGVFHGSHHENAAYEPMAILFLGKGKEIGICLNFNVLRFP